MWELLNACELHRYYSSSKRTFFPILLWSHTNRTCLLFTIFFSCLWVVFSLCCSAHFIFTDIPFSSSSTNLKRVWFFFFLSLFLSRFCSVFGFYFKTSIRNGKSLSDLTLNGNFKVFFIEFFFRKICK